MFFVADRTETKQVKGTNVEAILFTIGSTGWFWMPKSEFVQSTEPHDIKKQTGIPHQLDPTRLPCILSGMRTLVTVLILIGSTSLCSGQSGPERNLRVDAQCVPRESQCH